MSARTRITGAFADDGACASAMAPLPRTLIRIAHRAAAGEHEPEDEKRRTLSNLAKSPRNLRKLADMEAAYQLAAYSLRQLLQGGDIAKATYRVKTTQTRQTGEPRKPLCESLTW